MDLKMAWVIMKFCLPKAVTKLMIKKPASWVTQAGFTILELMMAMGIFSLLVTLIGQVIWQQSQATTRIRVESQTQETVQILQSKLERSLSSSKRVFGREGIGNNYLAKLNGIPTNTIVLPTIRPYGVLAPTKTCDIDDENYFWPLSFGNAFFHVEVAKSVNNYGPGIPQRKLDLFQFVIFYPKPSTLNLSTLPLPVLELTEWRSGYYVEYQDYMTFLSALDPGDRTTVQSALQALNVEALWNSRSETIANAFHNLGTDPAATEATTRKPVAYTVPKLVERHALLFKNESDTQLTLAYNRNTDKNSAQYFPINQSVPKFYTATPLPNAASCGTQAIPAAPPSFSAPYAFPGGFEVGIVGGSSSREVLFSTTFVSRAAGVSVENQDQIIITAREF